MSDRPIVVFGAGAVGMFLAARLAARFQVAVEARGGALDALASGIVIRYPDGRSDTHPVEVRSAAPVPLASGTLVLLAVKAPQIPEALTALAPRMPQDGAIALCSNGIGVLDLARDRWPAVRFIRAGCWFGVGREDARTVRFAGGNAIEIGADSPEEREDARILGDRLEAVGFQVRPAPSGRLCEWHKALGNLATNGLCSLIEARNGAIMDWPALRTLADEILAEALRVAHAEGVKLGPDDLDHMYAALETTRDNWNSLLQDLRAGRPTEMAFLNGAVSRLAERHALTAPLNRAMATLIEVRSAFTAGRDPGHTPA